MNLPKCYRCKYLHFLSSGYSDWTVTSEWLNCLKEQFKIFQSESENSDKGILEIASEKCVEYEYGKPLATSPDDDTEEEIKKHLIHKE